MVSMKDTAAGLDTAKVAGLIVLGALLTLGVTRRAFGGVAVGFSS